MKLLILVTMLFLSLILVILFLILELIILHFMIKKSIKISKVLPQLIINWLEDIEESSNDSELFKYFKETNIRLLYICTVIFIIVIITF